jgi:hypothetical protein
MDDAELTADALGLMRQEHERLAELLMFAIDIVDHTQTKGHRIDTAKMRQEFGRKIRESLVGRELALGQLGDRLAELCCAGCGAEVDLMADNPLGDWEMGQADDGSIGVLCPTCVGAADDDDDRVAASIPTDLDYDSVPAWDARSEVEVGAFILTYLARNPPPKGARLDGDLRDWGERLEADGRQRLDQLADV